MDGSPVTRRTLLRAVVVHLFVFFLFWLLSLCIDRDRELPPPTELTIVPPWAEQTDDPEPDPLPPPEDEPPPPVKQPPPAPKAPEVVQDAVVREKPKEPEKPKEKPKPLNLKEKAKLVTTPPKPFSLRDKAKKVDAPPEIPRTGKATAADKSWTPEEFNRLMNQGYQIGAKNQLASSEAQRCTSLIKRAIQVEWDKSDDFNWNPGLQPLQVQMRFGVGGQVLGFRILRGSGDPDVDRSAKAALDRVRMIPGLSPSFLRECPVIDVEMRPTNGG